MSLVTTILFALYFVGAISHAENSPQYSKEQRRRDLEQQCRPPANSGEACYEAAVIYSRADHIEEAIKFYKIGCDNNDQKSCDLMKVVNSNKKKLAKAETTKTPKEPWKKYQKKVYVSVAVDDKYVSYKNSCARGDTDGCNYLSDRCGKNDLSACRMIANAYSVRPESKDRDLGFSTLTYLCNKKDALSCKYLEDSKWADNQYKKQHPAWQREEAEQAEARNLQNRQIEIFLQQRKLEDARREEAREDAAMNSTVNLIQSFSRKPAEQPAPKQVRCTSNPSYTSAFGAKREAYVDCTEY